ncbi:MAG: YfiR family protein [Gammaproteobacteria bacterium]|nr:YfiR family protein [Gammaproteobacteria bacterium]
MAKGWRHICWVAFVTTWLVCGSASVFSELNTNQIKSAYLYQISKFVFWPEARKQFDHFNLCLLGPDSYQGNLQKMVGRTVFNKPVQLKAISSLNQATTCHLLVLSEPDTISQSSLQAWLKKNPVLTIADGSQNIEKAMVVFVLEEQRVRLHINVDLARSAGLSFAANLLEVASKIKTGGSS